MKKWTFGKRYKELFCIPKHEKLTDTVFRCRMALSILIILMCMAVMAASTFALFYSEVSTDHFTIAGAYYSVTVDNTKNGSYICPLAFEDKHTFVIKADGTATTGYCKIQVGEQVYYTEQIFRGSSLVVTVQAAKDTPIRFTPEWGALPDTTCGTEIIHSTTPSAVYQVEPTAKLSSIAAHYGVPEADIIIYNNLLAVTPAINEESTTPLLLVGMQLKIPNPAEHAEPYKVPYATYIVEPTATLDAVSAHYGVSIEDITAFNDMTTYGVGMSLKIPNVDPNLPDYAVPYATYIVEPTAIPSLIANHYGVSLDTIYAFNGIQDISVDMHLRIPGVSSSFTPYSVPYAVYTAEPTATLANISAHYGIAEWAILKFNGISDVSEGMTLRIPGVPSDTAPYIAPIPESPAVDDTVSGGDTISPEQPTVETPTEETDPAEEDTVSDTEGTE